MLNPLYWTQDIAIELCKQIESICPEYGVHVALTGGCLYHEGERKDCDILFYAIRQTKPDFFGLWKALETIGILLLKDHGFCIKAKYFEKSIDIFWPEADYGQYPEPVII